MTDREAMRLALEKCEWGFMEDAANILRQAIAEAEKQAKFDKEFAIYAESDEGKARSKQAEKAATLQEISDIGQEIEQATIKQGWDVDSLLAKPEQAEKQEPVASIYISSSGEREFDDWNCALPIGRNELYTVPPKQENELDIAERAYFHGKQQGIAECEAVKREWVGLTDQEIWEADGLNDLVWGRNIEAKLREKNT
jgi:hypothetical protein